MCRSIKRLRDSDGPADEDEVRAAALQFVRKVSGVRSPSPKVEALFDAAVAEVAMAVTPLIASLGPVRGGKRDPGA